jgi:hypothetical protein
MLYCTFWVNGPTSTMPLTWSGAVAAAMVAAPARQGVPDDDGRAAQAPDQRDQVAGDVSAGDRLPVASARLAVPAHVRRRDPESGPRQFWHQEPEGLPSVPDAVRQHDQRPLPGDVVSNPPAIDVQKLGHAALQKAIDSSL